MPIRLAAPAALLSATLLVAAPAAAQDLRVTADEVILRHGPSKFTHVDGVLRAGAALELVRPDSLRHGFYHVRAAQGQGWVHHALVERIAAQALAGTALHPVVLGASSPAASVSPAWEKPPLALSIFHEGAAECGPFGSAGDSVTNQQKNRADVPMRYHAVSFAAVADSTRLRFPRGAPTSRVRWTPRQTAEFVTPFEGIPVAVVGYIRVIRPQAGNQESTNCRLKGEANTDWHVALVGRFGDPESGALVVEPTPRLKQRNGGRWTRARLRRWEDPQSPADSVRISGYLLMDPAHPGHLGRYRGTLWEIHPVTRIEVMRDGAWHDLAEEP
jgi:hypothetical protein